MMRWLPGIRVAVLSAPGALPAVMETVAGWDQSLVVLLWVRRMCHDVGSGGVEAGDGGVGVGACGGVVSPCCITGFAVLDFVGGGVFVHGIACPKHRQASAFHHQYRHIRRRQTTQNTNIPTRNRITHTGILVIVDVVITDMG